MKPPPNAEHFSNQGCQPHQAAFAAKFFAPDAPRIVPLCAPVGAGKCFTAAAICNHALTSGKAKAILVIAASQQHARDITNVMESRSESTSVRLTDRRRWWQLEADVPVGANPWPTPGIIVLSSDTLKHRDVTDGLRLAAWDIIVLHGMDHDTNSLVRALLISYPKARVLCILDGEAPAADEPSNTVPTGAPPTAKGSAEEAFTSAFLEYLSAGAVGATVTGLFAARPFDTSAVWKTFFTAASETTGWADLLKSTVSPTHSLPTIRWIEYARSDAEIAVAQALREHLHAIARDSPCRPQAASLLRAASSSLYCLERILVDVSRSRNRLAQIRQPGLQGVNKRSAQILDAARNVLPLIERVSRDSKAATVRAILARIRPRRSTARAYIYTRTAATADYLCTTLEGSGTTVAAVTDRMPYQEQKKAVADAENAHGVVVITPDAAVAIKRASSLILHDLPDTLVSWTTLAFSFSRANSGTSVDFVSLTDTTGCLPHEAVERQSLESGTSASDDDILRAV